MACSQSVCKRSFRKECFFSLLAAYWSIHVKKTHSNYSACKEEKYIYIPCVGICTYPGKKEKTSSTSSARELGGKREGEGGKRITDSKEFFLF